MSEFPSIADAAVETSLPGFHHVTAITADAQTNLDFYTGVLGLRLVKRTVNFDDPGSYHLYYGDDRGTPGTILTFFAWPGAHRGNIGAPQAAITRLAIAETSAEFWFRRLREAGLDVQRREEDSRTLLSFSDPDGLRLELIGVGHDARPGAAHASIPLEHALRGLHSVCLWERRPEKTVQTLTELLGLEVQHPQAEAVRLNFPADAISGGVDVAARPEGPVGSMGPGTVHHVAFRTATAGTQRRWQERLSQRLNTSPVMDRTYFQSIYFREPGGVLFEIATDRPGFGVDEAPEALGRSLRLPPWLEPSRPRIESALPKLRLSEP